MPVSAPRLTVLMLVLTVTHEAAAQRATNARVAVTGPAVNTPASALPAPSPQHGRGASFVLEALSGSLGSLAGISVGLARRCGVDDMACAFTALGVAGVLGVVGATVGTVTVARSLESPRSTVGAVLGGVIGFGVGLYVSDQASHRNLGDDLWVPVVSLSQGVLAAAGSRVAATLTQPPAR